MNWTVGAIVAVAESGFPEHVFGTVVAVKPRVVRIALPFTGNEIVCNQSGVTLGGLVVSPALAHQLPSYYRWIQQNFATRCGLANKVVVTEQNYAAVMEAIAALNKLV